MRLPNELRAAIDRWATEKGMSRSEAIRTLIKRGLKKYTIRGALRITSEKGTYRKLSKERGLGRSVGKTYDAACMLTGDRRGIHFLFFLGNCFRSQVLRRDTINTR
jgi:hypothetical protein